ncbi:MAG: hypothetical protein KGI50_03625 [Patescibacteria group bacterium]|nr:hypothetical protein [Patescibacteria group bacterium]MDE2438381.1 hypothetical protein [Patescibacteria group bacterium]
MRLLKQLDWTNLVLWPVVYFTLFFIIVALTTNAPFNANTFLFIALAVLFYTKCTHVIVDSNARFRSYTLTIWSGVLVILEVLSALIMLCAGVYCSNSLYSITPSKGDTMLFGYFFTTVGIAWLYLTICSFTLRTRYVVPPHTLVVLDGMVLYPGMEFKIFPWIKYNWKAFEATIPVTDIVRIECMDGTQEIAFSATVKIDTDLAQQQGIANVPISFTKNVEQIVREEIKRIFRERAQSQTLGHFLTAPFEEEKRFSIENIPFVWNGEGTFMLPRFPIPVKHRA